MFLLLLLLLFFCHRVYCRRSSNVLSIWSLWLSISHTVFCVYEEGRKKMVYVEYLLEMHVSVYMWKGGRKLIILVDYYYRYRFLCLY